MKNCIKLALGLVIAALLAACGGGGGSAGTTSGGSSGGTTTPGGSVTLSVTDFAVTLDKTTILNGGTDTSQLTVIAVDGNRNAVSGAAVAVAVNQNAVFTPASALLTDAAGAYRGAITIGSDKTDRDVIVAVTVNGITKQVAVRVSGSRVTLQLLPASPAPGQAVTMTAVVTDSSGNPIAGAAVSFTSDVSSLQGLTGVTNASGQFTRAFLAPTVAGVYSINAGASGVVSGANQLQVFATTIPSAVIPAGAAPSLAASPNVLAVNSPGSTSNRTTLRFLFLDASNRPIPNVRVRFSDQTTGLPTVGASIASGGQTLYTDAAGVVSTQYISGQNASPTNGVTVRACYSANEFASATDCPNFVNASLTVAGQALAVSIGDDNLLTPSSGTYIKEFVITVADSAGRAVANAPVDISVDLTHYGKGAYSYGNGTSSAAYFDVDGNSVSSLQVVPASLTGAYPTSTTVPGSTTGRVWCANEDTNRNGNVDAGENIDGSTDSNGQATLEPRKSDLLVSYKSASVTTTNSAGVLLIQVQYSQRFGTWLAYKVRVTANVAGSQGMAERLFVTDVVAADVPNGSFRLPPYGVNSCSTAN